MIGRASDPRTARRRRAARVGALGDADGRDQHAGAPGVLGQRHAEDPVATATLHGAGDRPNQRVLADGAHRRSRDEAASELEEQHQLSFWDALIVATARKGGASRVLTEDLSPGQTISGIRIDNPFRIEPAPRRGRSRSSRAVDDGHEAGTGGHGQGEVCGSPRQRRICSCVPGRDSAFDSPIPPRQRFVAPGVPIHGTALPLIPASWRVPGLDRGNDPIP